MSLIGRCTPCVVLAAAVTLALAACGTRAGSDSAGPGGSSASISVGSVGPESGAESAIFVANEAMKAYFENMNASGGINGKKVNVYVDDDQFNAANTQGAVRGLVDQDKVQMTCAIAGTPDNAAVRPYLTQQKIPNVAPGTAPLTTSGGATNDYEFYMLPSYENAVALLTKYAVQTLHRKKVGIVYTPDTAGLPALAGMQEELKQLGLPAGATATYQIPVTSMATQAAAMKAAGVDFVIDWDTPANLGLLENAAAQIGYHPDFGAGWFAAGQSLERLTKGAFDGHQFFMTWLPISSDPAAATIKSVLGKYAPQASVDNGQTIQGWVAGDICAHVLQQATSGGKALTSASLLTALNHFSLSDQYVQGIDWSQSHHLGSTEGRILEQTANGTVKALTSYEPLPDVPAGS